MRQSAQNRALEGDQPGELGRDRLNPVVGVVQQPRTPLLESHEKNGLTADDLELLIRDVEQAVVGRQRSRSGERGGAVEGWLVEMWGVDL